MKYALSFSGGKDSTLALDHSLRDGLEVAALFNIYEGSTGRVRFHGVRAERIRAQAEALAIPLIEGTTHPDDYETVFLRVLDRLLEDGIGGIIFGNIHLADIRAWYEERVLGRGLEHIEPLWGIEPEMVVREVIDRGYVATIASIDLARAPQSWLGRQVDHALLAEMLARPEIDACGERGEYHTYVSDGPIFRHPVPFGLGERVEIEGHALVDITPVAPYPAT